MTLTSHPIRRHDHLTFNGNLRHTRHGWLRLTPAYSVNLVNDILSSVNGGTGIVLDPFGGTGTTALTCAERGIQCDTTDINPFLLWLTSAKAAVYTPCDIERFKTEVERVSESLAAGHTDQPLWIPALHQIEKWWDETTLASLAAAMATINVIAMQEPDSVSNLLRVTFCRIMIESSNASFAHQSMSFRKNGNQAPLIPIRYLWDETADLIARSAASPVLCEPRAISCDARDLLRVLSPQHYTCVITSPPYPNRMSYIRELRPYMYWLGYLTDARQAGDMDWQAIGGTWGCATSNVGKWTPDKPQPVPFPEFTLILKKIADSSDTLSRYVHKYFYDMITHVDSLYRVMAHGGSVHYIVGNSKFYNVLLPVEQIFSALFENAGFRDITITPIRKRSSKRELFEFVVSAIKP